MTIDNTLIIGGCRSGKSRYALRLADTIEKAPKIFVATCIPRDQEMQTRVDNHQKERGQGWQTIEAPLNVPEVLAREAAKAGIILIDCLTLWVSNLLMQNEDGKWIKQKGRQLAAAVQNSACPVILVTNEVGLGIVPDNHLARLFRDAAGAINQTIAAACNRVFITVAGIPVMIK
jgi:adenosylcobinamide kinase / adenosylcobinamide-phosphate guanylyltransferase